MIQNLTELKARQNENQMQLESMQQKAELLISDRETVSDASPHPWELPAASVSADEIEIAFLSEKQRRK